MKDEKQALVPRLRFPEFRDAGEWDIAPLKKLANRRTERNRDGKLTRVLTNSAEHGVVDQSDYFDKDIATQGNLENYFIVKKDDFVYNPRVSAFAPVGPISRNRVETGVMSPLYTVFQFKGSNTDFYAHYFKSSAWHMYMRQVGSTGARHDRMAISNEDFIAMPIPVPSPEEQQKIADCLSSLDALIAAQVEKIDALKTHKKGLMQQLFPREGETVPRLRFPEFRNAGEWNVGTIGDVADVSSGGTPNRSEAEYWNGDIPWVSTSLIDFGTIEFANEYITREGLDNSSAKIVPNGTVLMAMYGQGKTRGKVAVLGINAAINQACAAISVKDAVLSEFVFQNLAGRYDAIRRISNAGGQENLSGTLTKDISFKFPSIESGEQEKIANFLSSLDSLIAAHSEKLDALKAHKKCLLQRLFPGPEAIYG